MKVQWMAATLAGLSITSAVSAQDSPPPAGPAAEIHAPHHAPDGRIGHLEAELEALKCRLNAPAPVYCAPAEPAAPVTPSGMYFGAEAVFIKPHINNAFGFQRLSIDPVTGDRLFRTREFDFDYEASPRIFGGFTGENGYGIRGSWWQYDDSAAVASVQGANDLIIAPLPLLAGPFALDVGNVFNARYNLDLETYDLEGTSLIQVGSTVINAGAGVRYMEIEQGYSASLSGTTGGVGTVERLRARSDFDGVGPTFSLAAVQPIVNGFSFYAKSRMSVLFGDREQEVSNTATIGGVAQAAAFVRDERDDDTVTIGEVGVGLMFTHDNFFMTGGWEGQMWWDAGGNPFGLNTTSQDIALEGFNVGGGIVW